MTMPDYIKITHQPKTMATPTIRAALTSDDIPPVPLSEDDLRRGWNQQADRYNQWESLDSAERLAWAQALAIKADRHAAALKAEPSVDEVDELCAEFGFHCDDSDGPEVLRDMIAAALARWVHTSAAAPAPGENPAAPPAPEAGEAVVESGLTLQSAIDDFRSQLAEEANSRYPQTSQDAELDAFASGASWAWVTYATAIAGGFGQAPQAKEGEA